MVMGTRLKGKIEPGAMPPLHRYLGNPFLSWLLNALYKTGISDSFCGMRAFTKDALQNMHLRTGGMEFAFEMVIKATKAKLKIREILITLHPDGRTRSPHLSSFKDGWRTLRFMLMYSPRHLFGLPGGFLFAIGTILLVAYFLLVVDLLPGVLGGILTLAGWVIQRFGFYARAHQFTDEFPDWDLPLQRFFQRFSLERSLVSGLIRIVLGVLLLIGAYNLSEQFFERLMLLGVLVVIFGMLTVFDAFLTRILQFVGLK